MSDWLDLKLNFFILRLLTTFPDFLTYYLFEGCPGELSLTCFSCILLIKHFPDFLTTFSKNVRLIWPQTFFLVSRLVDHELGFRPQIWFKEDHLTRLIVKFFSSFISQFCFDQGFDMSTVWVHAWNIQTFANCLPTIIIDSSFNTFNVQFQ